MLINTKNDLEKLRLPDDMADELIYECEEIRSESRNGNCIQWINIKDELPKQGGVYLAVDKDVDIAICSYWPHMKPTWEKIDGGCFKPSHWMTLPPPPKDGE